MADRLAALYFQAFGGKESGWYRVSATLVCQLVGRCRRNEDDVRDPARALFECGFVFIDMERFFVVMATHTFVNERRANGACLDATVAR